MLLNDTATLIADSNQNLRSGTNGFVRDLMQAGRAFRPAAFRFRPAPVRPRSCVRGRRWFRQSC